MVKINWQGKGGITCPWRNKGIPRSGGQFLDSNITLNIPRRRLTIYSSKLIQSYTKIVGNG